MIIVKLFFNSIEKLAYRPEIDCDNNRFGDSNYMVQLQFFFFIKNYYVFSRNNYSFRVCNIPQIQQYFRLHFVFTVSVPAYSIRFRLRNDDVNVFRFLKFIPFKIESVSSVDLFCSDLDLINDTLETGGWLSLIIEIDAELFSSVDREYRLFCASMASLVEGTSRDEWRREYNSKWLFLSILKNKTMSSEHNSNTLNWYDWYF